MPEDTIRVLVVDDDAGFVSIIKHLLGPFQGKNFEVLWENDGEKAIDQIRANSRIDILLMDYYLPNKTGLEITKQIYDEKFSIPMIMLTANRDFRVAVEAMKYGVEDYVLKEETGDSILPRTILNVLDRVRLKKKIANAEKHSILSRKRTEVIKELIVTMCHEFNNPLATIKLSATHLVRRQTSDIEHRLLDTLLKNVSILDRQIKRLRDLNTEE